MARKKKEEYNPSVFASAFVGAICAFAGAFLAVINLAFIPVTTADEMPPAEERKPQAVYFIKGSEKGGNAWKQKRTLLERSQSGTLTIDEADLNKWARSTFKPDPKAGEGGGMLAGLEPEAQSPNFRMWDDRMQIAAQISIPMIKGGKKFTYQTEGRMVNDGGVFRFKAERGYLGSCPIPGMAGLPGMAYGFFFKNFSTTEEYAALNPIWNTVNDVSIENGVMNISMP